jgi:predicted transcriptional regulator
MIALVDRASELNRTINSKALELSELQRVKREIAATDAEIDDLVFKLYDVTEKEREIVEAARP